MKNNILKYLGIFTCFFAIVALSIGCQEKHSFSSENSSVVPKNDTLSSELSLPAGLSLPVEDLANPSFFDQDPEVFQTFFTRPDRAEYIREGMHEEIPANDARLIRLMNLLDFSMKNSKTIWRQELVSDAEAREWMNQTSPILIIHFPADLKEEYDPINQIIVCGSECLIFYQEQSDSSNIEDHWPCAQYLRDLIDAGTLSEIDYLFFLEHARKTPWLDSLAYCGFEIAG